MSMPRSGHQRAQAVLEGLRLVWQRVAGTIMTGPRAPRTARTKGAGMLRGFATVNYWTDDLAAATRWYAELLGVDPYFERPGPDGRPAYVEFRVGDYQHELGLLDRRFAPGGPPAGTGGVVLYWHVDDVRAAVGKLLSMGAKEYQPVTELGDAGFVIAAVVDPFGNILGVMYNPHYLEVLGSTGTP
jgi:predicted enzyme related to lactoylglutathione lyase